MNCTDVMSLARAAPEPASSTRVNSQGDGNSFDQFLKTVTMDRPSSTEELTGARSSNHEEIRDDQKRVEPEPKEQKPVNEKQVNEKPVEKPESQEPVKAEDEITEVIAAAVAAQVLNVVAPAVLPEETAQKAVSTEATVPVPLIQVQPNSQANVIQLPDTEPQPLPDELNQAVQQPKVEVKDFQTLVDAAAQNLETQTVQAGDEVVTTVATGASEPVIKTPAATGSGNQEPAVKLVEMDAQPEDLAAMEVSRSTGGLYALSAAKSDNLIQPKTLPIIREISQEVVNLAREQGKSMRIQVHPENMGKIDLRLISNSDGIRVVMTAEIPATAKLLENHMNQLNQSLKDAGLNVNGTSVNSQGAQGQSGNPSLNQSQQGFAKTSLPIFQQEAELVSPVAVQVSTSGLDYRV